MKYLISAMVALMFISCNSGGTNEEDNASKDQSPSSETAGNETGGCYMKVTGRDTAILAIESGKDEFTGRMMFDNYEKDGSRGIVKGITKSDIVHVWYDFQSEGTRSVMEIFFKKEGNKLIRGIGKMDVKGDTTYYADPDEIAYSATESFEQADCPFVKSKF